VKFRVQKLGAVFAVAPATQFGVWVNGPLIGDDGEAAPVMVAHAPAAE